MELTAAQHASVRRHIALLPAYGWAVYIWTTTIQQLPLQRFHETGKVFRDFAHFYVLGLIARRHDVTALYDVSAQRMLVAAHVPATVDTVFPPSYGPQVALLFEPFAYTSYIPALWIWLALSVGLFAISCVSIWRRSDRLRGWGWPVFVLTASAPAFYFTLLYGQTSALAASCFVAAYLALARRQHLLAGLAIGALFYKPQLGVAAAVLCVAGGQWRVVTGAVVAVAVQLLGAAWYWGGGILATYADALLRIPQTLVTIEPEKRHLHSWRAFFQLLGLSDAPLTSAVALASLVTLAIAVVAWRSRGDLRLRFTVLLTTTVLVSPHLYVYDLLILVPACLLFSDALLDGHVVTSPHAWPAWLAVSLVWMGPFLGFLAPALRIQLSVVGACAMLMLSAVALQTATQSLPDPQLGD